jgi:pyruvate, water dikinase
MKTLVLWLEEARATDVQRVGGKNASLGEMLHSLSVQGVRVPGGFATTAAAYRDFLSFNGLDQPIGEAMASYRAGKIGLADTGARIRRLIMQGHLPPVLQTTIRAYYSNLGERVGIAEPAVAVRSSATAEDRADASFAGQQETFLNVRGAGALIDACRRCFASLFTDRAITYRDLNGFDHLDVALSVGVQQMVRSDLGGSGVMFTLDTESGFPRVAVINAAWGLGETVVQGSVDPDKYMLFKPLLADPVATPIIEKNLGGKAIKLIYGGGRGKQTRLVRTSSDERSAFVLTDSEILQLGRWGAVIEQHYRRPMDIEWARDGETGELFVVQARPETVHSTKVGDSFDIYHLEKAGRPILQGAAVGVAIVAARACVIRRPADIASFRDGCILVAEATDPDWVPVMKRAVGIVTDHGGSTSHAAIVSRELGVPAVVGTGTATARIEDGQEITLSCAEGDKGFVFSGKLSFARETIDAGALPKTRTAVMVNIANPEAAFQWWRLPAKGVGLARMEFIISALIKAHPMALAHPERLGAAEAERVRRLTKDFADPCEYFVDTLARGIARLAAPFHPHPAIVRLSDFKTNEYAGLIGGKAFEPEEENPMLGFRGASRYYDDRYRDGFALECRALKRVREEMGFSNVIVMVPFCRTPGEADKVLAAMAANGLRRGENGLQIYMMCEIPSNVVLAREFAARFDGFSIGSNDLTQLVLGVDRDSGDLTARYDERDEAVLRMIAQAIREAHAAGIKVGICGQAPSNYPDFARFLVDADIDSISLNPDSFLKTVGVIADAETGDLVRLCSMGKATTAALAQPRVASAGAYGLLPMSSLSEIEAKAELKLPGRPPCVSRC